MSDGITNKIAGYNKQAKDALEDIKVKKKRNSDSTLERDQFKQKQEIDSMLKNEVLRESRETGTIDPYSNTPSKQRISPVRSFSLNQSAYSNKLLEKILKSQTDNEFTKASLAYQETSLKLLEEIKDGIKALAPAKEEESNNRVEVTREISGLANAAAQLDVKALLKELKRASVRTIDKSGFLSSIGMFGELIMGMAGDKDSIKSMVKGKIKNSVLTQLFGSNGAQMVGRFEEDPLNAIQDFINANANSKNPFLRALFGKNVSRYEIKKPDKERKDAKEFKSLQDKLTYNTINYRIPETLDKMLSALTGEIKKSYDYETNTYVSDVQKMERELKSGNIVDIQSMSNNIMEDLKSMIEEKFENGTLSAGLAGSILKFDRSKGEFVKNAKGGIASNDDEALNALLLNIIQKGGDLNSLRKAPIMNYLRSNSIRIDGMSNERVTRAAQNLQQIIQQLSINELADFDDEILSVKESASNMNMFRSAFANMNSRQTTALSNFRSNKISKAEFDRIMLDEETRKFSGSNRRPIIPPGGGGGLGYIPSLSNSQMRISFLNGGIDIGSVSTSDSFRNSEDFRNITDIGKNASSDISSKGHKESDDEKYRSKLKLLVDNGVISQRELSSSRFGNISITGSSVLDDNIKSAIDEKDLIYNKALELFNYFFNAEQTPQQLEAKTGQEARYWKQQGYPESPADLFKYIRITKDEDGKSIATVDYQKLAHRSVKFTEDYIGSLKKKYRLDNSGHDFDITNPEKSMSKILSETFKDPQVNKRMGIKAGSAAGFAIGKIMLSKGMASSPYLPYMLGGIGGAIMNMESVQRRINMILGPEGELKGESGFSNREIWMSKFINKTLPRLGAAAYVTRNVQKVFQGTGLFGSAFGLLGGGALGLLTGMVAPSLLNWGRKKLFEDDGEGNKGFIKGIGNMLREIPFVEKYLGMSVRRGDTDNMIASQVVGELISEVDAEIEKLQTSNMTHEDKRRLERLFKLKNTLKYKKKLLLSDKSTDFPKKGENETDDDYKERIINYVLKDIRELKGSRDATTADIATELENSFLTTFDKQLEKRDNMRDIGRDISKASIDKNILKTRMKNVYKNMKDQKMKKKVAPLVQEIMEDDSYRNYDKIAKTIMDHFDSDGEKKDRIKEYEKYLREAFTDSDYAISNILDDTDKQLLKEGKLSEFMDRIENDDEKMDAFADFVEMGGNLSKNYLNDDELNIVRELATLQARALYDTKDEGELQRKADEIFQSLLSVVNKKSFEEIMSSKASSLMGKIKEQVGKITGDSGIMDGSDKLQEEDTLDLLRDSGILVNDKYRNRFLQRKRQREQEIMEEAQENSEEEESGSGSQTVKMKDLSKYKFKNGTSLDITGCSIATLNNMLVSMGLGSVLIKDLISIANNYLTKEGSIKAEFFKEVAIRMGMRLTIYRKSDASLNETTIKKYKPSKKTGIILLKANPGKSFGHYVHWNSINSINDPEVSGLTKVTFADILLMSDMMLVFELTEAKTTKGTVETDGDSSKEPSLKQDKKTLGSIIKEKVSSKFESIKSKFGFGSSKDDVSLKLAEINETLKNGILNIRIVDDLMLPLKLTDYKSSKRVGDLRKRIKSGDVSAYSNAYDKVRETSQFKEEFKKAEMVQDAIINGGINFANSGAGTAVADPNALKDQNSGGGLLSGILGGAGALFGGRMLSKTKNWVMKKLGFKVAEEATEEIAERGIKKAAKNGVKNISKKVYKKVMQYAFGEAGEKWITSTLKKIGPMLVKAGKGFFGLLVDKAPKILKPFFAKMGTKLITFGGKLVSTMIKFGISNASKLSGKITKLLARGVGMKIPYVGIGIAIGMFTMSFYSGYKNAAKYLRKEDVGFFEKVATGFAKGIFVALPGALISLMQSEPIMFTIIAAAFEMYMEAKGFQDVIDWFMGKSNELSETEDKNLPKQEDINKVENEIDEETIEKSKTFNYDEALKQNGIDPNSTTYKLNESGNPKPNTQNPNNSNTGGTQTNTQNTDTQQTPSNQTENKSSESWISKAWNGIFGSKSDTKKNSQQNNPSKPQTTQNSSKEDGKAKGYDKPKTGNTSSPTKPSTSPVIPVKDIPKPKSARGGYLYPVNNPFIVSTFGPRPWNGFKLHRGVDFRGKYGDPVFSVKDGTVVSYGGDYNTLVIKHNDGTYSRYLHLSKSMVKPGQNVKAGQHIAAIGGKGPNGYNQYNPHLHFELMKTNDYTSKTNRIDPVRALGMNSSQIKMHTVGDSNENALYLDSNRDIMREGTSPDKLKVMQNIIDKTKKRYGSEYNANQKWFVKNYGGVMNEVDGKGGPDVPTHNSPESSKNDSIAINTALSNLTTSLNNYTANAGEITKGDIAILENFKVLSKQNEIVIKLLSEQSKLMNKFIEKIGELKVNPADMHDISATRLHSSMF